jgi:hypothetical protein
MSTLTGPSEQAVAGAAGLTFHDSRHGQQTNRTGRHLSSAVLYGFSSEPDSLIRQAGSVLLLQVLAGQ